MYYNYSLITYYLQHEKNRKATRGYAVIGIRKYKIKLYISLEVFELSYKNNPIIILFEISLEK